MSDAPDSKRAAATKWLAYDLFSENEWNGATIVRDGTGDLVAGRQALRLEQE